MDREIAALKHKVRQQQQRIKELEEELADDSTTDDDDGSAAGSDADADEDEGADNNTVTSDDLASAIEGLQKAQRVVVKMARAVRNLGKTAKRGDAAPPDRERAIDELRRCLLSCQAVVQEAQTVLVGDVPRPGAGWSQGLLAPPLATSGYGRLRPLGDVIGPSPGWHWRNEWIPLNVEAFRRSGRLQYANEQHVRCNDTPERVKGNFQATIDGLIQKGWDTDDAEAYCLLGSAANAIGASVRERSNRYAASTYALCDALWARHAIHAPPPPLYWCLEGDQGLISDEPAWGNLETPDVGGWCGLTCAALVLCNRMSAAFTERGFRVRVSEGAGVVRFEEVDGPIVMFESAADDEFGAHRALITTSPRNGAFPPNTQFQLVRIEEPGTWEAPTTEEGATPLRPKQRLLVVSATYHAPRLDATGGIADRMALLAPKLCAAEAAFGFGRREVFFAGLDGLIDNPLLSLEAECARPDVTWHDQHGTRYTLLEQWRYVNAAAIPMEPPVTGINDGACMRDEGRAGMLPDDFVRVVNEHIAKRRKAGRGRLREEVAFLTKDEVLAIRLFTGPAYQPINAFLRHVTSARGEQRHELARHAGLTFAATVAHLCFGVRKLADVASDVDESDTLYVGMRGALPAGFVRGTRGPSGEAPCAVTTAFVSASRERRVPIGYMEDSGRNVLWELKPGAPSKRGLHCGADVALLSQFPGESEVLYPPGTMLAIEGSYGGYGGGSSVAFDVSDGGGAPAAAPAAAAPAPMVRQSSTQSGLLADAAPLEEGGKVFMKVTVRPTFL